MYTHDTDTEETCIGRWNLPLPLCWKEVVVEIFMCIDFTLSILWRHTLFYISADVVSKLRVKSYDQGKCMWLQVDEVVASLGSQCKGSLAPLLLLGTVKTIFLWSMRVISRSLPMSSCTGDNLVSRPVQERAWGPWKDERCFGIDSRSPGWFSFILLLKI